MSEEVSIFNKNENVITQCTCKIKNKNYVVSLTKAELRWQIAGSVVEKDIKTVRIVDILSVSLNSSSKQDSNNDSVCVSYVRQEGQLILKSCCVMFTAGESQLINNLHQQITDLTQNVTQKPKRLLVLINPVSGRSKGRTVYKRKVAPIFKDAGIHTDVIVTEKAHHTEHILSTYDTKTVDGLVLVGGDGLYHEAVNGLMRRLVYEQGLNLDNPDETLPEIDLPVGIIPCGTGNGAAYVCYDNYDPTTAALSIAIGYRLPSNILSVYSGNKLVAFSIGCVGYGTWADFFYIAESRRSQGRLRYPIALVEQMFFKALRRLNLTIQYINEDIPVQQNHTEAEKQQTSGEKANKLADNSSKGTSDNIEQSDTAKRTNNNSLQSATTKECVIGSIIFMLPLTIAFTSTEMPNLSQSVMYLNISTRRVKYISFMYTLVTGNFDAIHAREDIVILPGKEWTVKLEEPSQPETENWQLEHILNIDGEVFRLPKPEYQVKLLSGRMKLFSNRPYVTKRVSGKK